MVGLCFARLPDDVLSSLYEKIIYEEKEELITRKAFYEYLQTPLMIQGYFNYGFRANGRFFGISVATGVETPALKKIGKEFTQTLASRNVCIPLLKDVFDSTDMPHALLEEYLRFQILTEMQMFVKKTFRIQFYEGKNTLGYIYIVNAEELSLQKTGDEKTFIGYLLKDIRGSANQLPADVTLSLFEYALSNTAKFGLSHPQQWQMLVYSAALYLNASEKKKAQECLKQLPEEIAELWKSQLFNDQDFLLLGDLFLIFGDEAKTFSSWAYGMQINPLNKTLEERFQKYSD